MAHEEKDRRVYYQDIVYAVCQQLDEAFARRVHRGEGVVCGTVESPSKQVQELMEELVNRDRVRLDALHDLFRVADDIAHALDEAILSVDSEGRNAEAQSMTARLKAAETVLARVDKVFYFRARTVGPASSG